MTRFGWVVTTYLSAVAATGPAFVNLPVKLIWNASASVPLGLYAVQPGDAFQAIELVAVMPPEPVASFLADTGYLPRGVLLMKRVLALPGQTICRETLRITVDHIDVGEAQVRDRRGRSLLAWEGCQTLRLDEIFLMNPDVSDSLDGRYFGPLPASSIVGRAIPLWTDEDGDGGFVWCAATH